MAITEARHEISHTTRVSWLFVSLVRCVLSPVDGFLRSFYFPGVLVGPYLDYASYISLIDESLFEGKRSPSSTRSIPDGRKRVAYRKMLTGLVFLGIFVVLSPSFYYAIVITPWFMTQGFLYRSVSIRSIEYFSDVFGCRMVYFQLSGFIERSKYYAIWTLTEVRFVSCRRCDANTGD